MQAHLGLDQLTDNTDGQDIRESVVPGVSKKVLLVESKIPCKDLQDNCQGHNVNTTGQRQLQRTKVFLHTTYVKIIFLLNISTMINASFYPVPVENTYKDSEGHRDLVAECT